jgi:hypothetical protein
LAKFYWIGVEIHLCYVQTYWGIGLVVRKGRVSKAISPTHSKNQDLCSIF